MDTPPARGSQQRESGCLGRPGRRDLCALSGSCFGHADPRMTARYAHVVEVVDMAKKNPALFISVHVG